LNWLLWEREEVFWATRGEEFGCENKTNGRIKTSYHKMKKYICYLFLAGLMIGCSGSGDGAGDNSANNDVVVTGDTIRVSQTSAIASKLVVDSVNEILYTPMLTTTGVVTAIPTGYAQVAAPFGGRVVRNLVHIGQNVRVGSPLFEISSSDYSDIVKQYIQSKAELDMAKRALDRTQDLHNNKVASVKELDEAKTAYALALEEYRHSVAVAKEFQIDLKSAEVGQPMVVRSPVSGRVLDNDLVIGEYLKEDAEAKVVVADLNRVWVKANVSEMDAPYMEGIEGVEVSLVARPDSVVKGRVSYVGGMLDPETRTVQTIIECDNPRQQMLPNMYARVQMKVHERKCIVLPKDAVLQGNDTRYVWRKVGTDTYCRTVVEVQSLDAERLIVTRGLNVGDEVITEGAYYLIDKH